MAGAPRPPTHGAAISEAFRAFRRAPQVHTEMLTVGTEPRYAAFVCLLFGTPACAPHTIVAREEPSMAELPSPDLPITELRTDLSLPYRLRPATGTPTACVLLLHGVGSNEAGLGALAKMFDPHWLVVLPRAPLQMGPQQFAWFAVRFTAHGPVIDAAQADFSRGVLGRFVEEIQQAHGITPARTVIAGFSQGGIMSAGLALTEPQRVAGFGLMSGRILPEIDPIIAQASQLRTLRGFVSHGRNDTTLDVSWAERANQTLDRLGVAHEFRLYSAGHEITPAMAADFRDWLGEVLGAAR